MAEGNKRVKGDGKGRQGGRQKGTPNKVSGKVREFLADFIEGKYEDFLASYDKIEDPYKKCCIYTDVLPYVAPKQASVEYKDATAVKTLADELDEISGEKTRQ